MNTSVNHIFPTIARSESNKMNNYLKPFTAARLQARKQLLGKTLCTKFDENLPTTSKHNILEKKQYINY